MNNEYDLDHRDMYEEEIIPETQIFTQHIAVIGKVPLGKILIS